MAEWKAGEFIAATIPLIETTQAVQQGLPDSLEVAVSIHE